MHIAEDLSTLNMLLGPGRAFSMADHIRFSPISLFQAASELMKQKILSKNTIIYDPFCGNGTILYALASYFPGTFQMLYGSDARQGAVNTARENLTLTEPDKLEIRINELQQSISDNPKVSKKWKRRLSNLLSLKRIYDEISFSITPYHIFHANVMNPNFADGNLNVDCVDVAICDPPYSRSCPWHTPDGKTIKSYPLEPTIKNISKYLKRDAPIIIFSNQGTNLELSEFPLVMRFNLDGYRLNREVSVYSNSPVH